MPKISTDVAKHGKKVSLNVRDSDGTEIKILFESMRYAKEFAATVLAQLLELEDVKEPE